MYYVAIAETNESGERVVEETGAVLTGVNIMSLLAGKRVLIVEDEYFLADETRRKLEKVGATVVGPVDGVDAALELIETNEIHAAILDVHLGDEFVFPVAEELERRQIPFVFATSYHPAIIPANFTGFALCEKPAELGKIAIALFGTVPDGYQ